MKQTRPKEERRNYQASVITEDDVGKS